MVTTRPVLFLNRRTDGNVGDVLSSPLNYFRGGYRFPIPYEIHLSQSRLRRRVAAELRDRARAIVIGGGGLLGQKFFYDDLRFWAAGPAPLVLWGAGHNSHDVLAVAEEKPKYEDFFQLSYFALIGIRDYGAGFNWVPCSSCMSPELQQPTSTESGLVLALHRDLKGAPAQLAAIVEQAPGATVLFNDLPAPRLIGALRAARAVVTNSFHAAYWASLLKKPVVAIGGGTKMLTLKHPVTVADGANWRCAVGDAEIHLNALEECRDRNVDFHRRVAQLVDRKPAPSRRQPFARDPLAERAADAQGLGIGLPPISRNRVPKIVHFIFGLSPTFGGKPFNIMHRIAVLSAIEKIQPEQVFLHYEYLPNTPDFAAVKNLLTLRKISAPDEVCGRPLKHFAHRADIVRMRTLLEHGGIYLDLDTLTVASFDRLLDQSFTIGIQGRTTVDGLCNAVMLSAPRDGFLSDWLDSYRRFSDEEWDRFSVRLPYAMWRSGARSINVEPYDTFHWPAWDGESLKMMFERDMKFPNAICHHLWESFSFAKYFAFEEPAQAVAALRAGRSSYARLARPYL